MIRRFKLIATGIFCALLAAGCSAMTPGDVNQVAATSDQPNAGNVYLLRGFIGIWSFGINDITKKINDSGVRANVYQENQWDEVCNAIIAKYQNNPNNEPLVVTPPPHIELKVLETDPGLKGDTATGGSKPAKMETGAVVRVPLFINEGEVLRIDTRTGEYISRGKA